MWKEGAIGIPDKQDKEHHIICHYWVKVYKRRSSRFGINGGRISKLMRLEAALQLQDKRRDHREL